jgi:hypothetical protein
MVICNFINGCYDETNFMILVEREAVNVIYKCLTNHLISGERILILGLESIEKLLNFDVFQIHDLGFSIKQ